MTDISVVMACRNAEETLEETLESIGRQQWERPWEVLFADNGSTDASAAIFDRFADRHPGIPMRRVDASTVQGKARALNLVVPMARGRAILLADSDDVMAPGWLAAMGAALDEADLVAAASEFQKLNAPWVLEYRLPDPATRSRNQETYHFFYQNIPFVSGHCMGFTRKLFDELGGFDVDYSVGDDVDFSFRAQLRGYGIRSVPEAVVHYRFRDELQSIGRQARLYARDQVKLSHRLPQVARPIKKRLKSFAKESRQVAGESWGYLVGRGWRNDTERARMRWQWGWYAGLLAGMIEFRAPPP
jgi:cellulose synthase/poly-beta-1,6-N-acetylglucosamine synthase-like glycosyltransferase